MVDGYGCEPEKLADPSFIRNFLDEFPENIGMTKLMSPYVSRYEESDQKEWGLSGFVLIAESHVSIHTFPQTGYVSIDVFSCKSFDTAAAEAEIIRQFGIKRTDRNILDRGVEYPKNPGMAQEIVAAERDRKLKAVGA
jgi:S-adenosylmethionine decarboxylase